MYYGGPDWREPLSNWETASNEDLKNFMTQAWAWFAYYRDRAAGMDDYQWELMVDQFDAIAAATSCGSFAGAVGLAMCNEMNKRRWEAAHGGRKDQAGAGHRYEGVGPAA